MTPPATEGRPPTLTIAELANQTGVTTRSIERTLNKLQQQNRRVRVGAAKGGHWKVLEPQ